MFNVLLILLAGLTIFNERHRLMKYVGGFMVLVSLVIITTQRRFDTHKEYSETEDESYTLALFCVMVTTVFWALTAIFGKYASYFYDANPVQFGALAMTISGLFGSGSVVFIVGNSIPFGLEEGYSFWV